VRRPSGGGGFTGVVSTAAGRSKRSAIRDRRGSASATPSATPSLSVDTFEALLANAPKRARRASSGSTEAVEFTVEASTVEASTTEASTAGAATVEAATVEADVWEATPFTVEADDAVSEGTWADAEVVVAETIAYDPDAVPFAAEMDRVDSKNVVGEFAAGRKDAAEVTLDVDVTSAEEVVAETWQEQVLAAVDLTLLATEVAVDSVTQSKALEMATEWVDRKNTPAAQDLARAQQWTRLKSLSTEVLAKRERSEAAQRELLDALTILVEKKS